MRQVIVDASGKNARIVILHDRMKKARGTVGSCIELDAKRFARKSTRFLPARRRAACLWITAALLATTWASETQAFAEAGHARADALASTQLAIAASNVAFGGTAGDRDVGTVQASRLGRKSVLVAQATAGDTEELRKALEQEHRRAELIERLLTLHKGSAESAPLNQAPESDHADLRSSLQQVRGQLKQSSESGAAGLCKPLQGDQANGVLEQDLAAARRDTEAQKALAAKANADASQVKQAAESGTAELRKSLQQEQERAGRLEQDLAATRRDVEAQKALAAKASDNASQVKQAAESGAAKLRKSLQQEQERAGRLEQDLAAASRDIEAQKALAAKASDNASQVKQAAESGAAELRKSLQQEQERTGRLEQDLAAARRDVEAQTALAAKANADATQLKQTAGDTTELKAALQRERERAERLEQGLAAARRDAETQTALAAKASEKAGQLKQTAENGTAELRKSLQEARERAAQLEQDLAVTRRDVKIQTALATQASDEATQLKQGAENCCAELKRSLQKEHDRAEALAQDLSMVHTAIYAYEAQTGRASDLAAGVKQAAESSAAELRNSLVREWERAARLHQSLAVTRGDVATQTALAIRVRAEAGRPKDVTEDNCVELLRALQQERDKTARLQRELVSERRTKDAHSACRVATTGQVMPDKQVEPSETRPVAKDQATVAEARGHAPPNREDAAEVAKLVARAGVLLGQGDVGSARIVLERAAETGNAQASFNLAETYDPLVLAKWRTYGTRGDATRARGLYARAQAGGIKEATERLDALRR